MDLYVIRHADAERNAATDFDRCLTGKGRKQAADLGRFLKSAGVRPNGLLSSPLVRAVETAEIIATALDATPLLVQDERLACGMTPEDACDMIYEHNTDGALLLFGHEPDFSRLGAFLSGMENAACFEMKKGACAAFDLARPGRGNATLKWLVTPKLLAQA